MKKLFTVAAASIIGMSCALGAIYVSPMYKKIGTDYGGVAFKKPEGFTIIGEGTADPDAVASLKKAFPGQGDITVYIGERGDEAVAEYEDRIPHHRQGYFLITTPKSVYIAGNDSVGTFYGVQTFLQLASGPEVPKIMIQDWPDTPNRGVVEGFYGNAWSFEDRESQFEFYGRHKLDTYIYGPKDDPYHRSKWREPYPEKEAENIRLLVDLARHNKVRFIWGLHPAGDHSWEEDDNRAAVKKLEPLYSLGVRDFAVFFDDVFGEHADGKKHAAMLDYVMKNFVNIHPDITSLIMCPSLYNKSWVPKFPETYLKDISAIDPFIQIMWTGDKIVNMMHTYDIEWVNEQIGRKAFVWHNYPVTDYCVDHLLLGPYKGNDGDVTTLVSGFTANPMEYAETSKVSLAGVADFLWSPEFYDPQKAWEMALKELVPEHPEAFRTFCLYNIDPGDTPHKFRIDGESPALKKLIDANGESIMNYSPEALEMLNREFISLGNASEELLDNSADNRLLTEIKPWLEVAKLLSLRGQMAVQMCKALNDNDIDDFNYCLKTYDELTRIAGTITSRDFPGSIKIAHPVVGTGFAEPLLKRSVEEMRTKILK